MEWLQTLWQNDQAVYVICILTSLILSLPLQWIKRPILRHLYGAFFGLVFCLVNFGPWSTCYCLVTSLAVWVMMNRQAPRWLVFGFAFLTCSIAHLWIMYHDYLGWHMDFTGVQNILTLKFVMWGFDLRYYFEQDASEPTDPNTNKDEAAQFDEKVKLTTRPTLIEYMSHLFWFANVLTMPIFSPQQHLNWVNKADTKGAFIPCLRTIAYAVLISLVHLTVGPYFVFGKITDGSWHNWPVVYKWWYLWMGMLIAKAPYYVGWLLAEASTIACGMGREASWLAPPGIKNADKPWSGASTVHIVAMETSRNFVEVTQSWNFSTSGWLRHYVYLRLPPRYATLVTFFVSALWHGFYPGYYIAFMGGAIHTIMGRLLFKRLDRFAHLGWPSTIALIAFNSFVTHYVFAGFILLGGAQCWHFYRDTYFVGYALIVLVMAGLYLMSKKKAIVTAK